MKLFGASNRVQLLFIPLALKEEAGGEYYEHMKGNEEYQKLRNASILLRIIAKRLETPEFIMEHKNKWTELTMADVRRPGDTIQKTFERLKKHVTRLQKILGRTYQNDHMLCDFFRRALQDEPFRGWVYDFEPDITAENLCGKIRNAIVKQTRINEQKGNTESMANTLENRRYGKPDYRRHKQKKPSRNGVVMKCTGCGSDEHFYRDCKNPNREEYRRKKLKEIAKMKEDKQKIHLRSYFTQIEDQGGRQCEPENLINCESLESSSESNCDDSFE